MTTPSLKHLSCASRVPLSLHALSLSLGAGPQSALLALLSPSISWMSVEWSWLSLSLCAHLHPLAHNVTQTHGFNCSLFAYDSRMYIFPPTPTPIFFFLEVRLHISSCYRSILDLIWPDWTMGLFPEACFVQSHPHLCWWQIHPFCHSDRSLGILATVFLMFHLWFTPIVWPAPSPASSQSHLPFYCFNLLTCSCSPSLFRSHTTIYT